MTAETPNFPPDHPVLKVIKKAAVFAAKKPNEVLAMGQRAFVEKFHRTPVQLGLREEEVTVKVMQGIEHHQYAALSAIYDSLSQLSLGELRKKEKTMGPKKESAVDVPQQKTLPKSEQPVPSYEYAARQSRKKETAVPWNPNMLSPKDRKIFMKVSDTLVDALGVDEDEVTPEATLIRNLGAESIDFLDIVFRLEKNCGIKIPRGELFPENLSLADASFIKDGVVTSEGIEELRRRLPHADVTDFERDPRVQNIADLFTVKMVMNYLKSKGV